MSECCVKVNVNPTLKKKLIRKIKDESEFGSLSAWLREKIYEFVYSGEENE